MSTKMTNAQLQALVSKLQAQIEDLNTQLSKMENMTAEQIFSPEETKETAIKALFTMLSQNVQVGNLGRRGCMLADLTQRAWKATTVAQIHMRVQNNQLIISIDRDLYLADKKKWMFAFGMIRGALEGTCLQYTYNNGQQYISLKKEEQAA